MARKDRMGSGLDMLFEDSYGNEETSEESGVRTLRISFIEPEKDQPRKNFDEQKLKELADNILENGVLQPILVRPMESGSYKIVAGERRWRAARIAGLTEVPVIVKELDDKQAAQIALIENLQREDLDPIEEARAYRRLMDEFDMTQEQLGKSVGKSRSGIANAVRLLSLPEDVQEMVSDGRISVGHAKLLCGIDDPVKMYALSSMAMSGISVREMERQMELIKEGENRSPEKPKKPKDSFPKVSDFTDPFRRFAAETALSFKQNWDIDAGVSREKGKYTLKLGFGSEEELMEFMKKLSELV